MDKYDDLTFDEVEGDIQLTEPNHEGETVLITNGHFAGKLGTLLDRVPASDWYNVAIDGLRLALTLDEFQSVTGQDVNDWETIQRAHEAMGRGESI